MDVRSSSYSATAKRYAEQVVAGSIQSSKVIEVLSRFISQRGAPAYLRSDNGPEFVATALLKWPTDNKIETALIEPGKPW